MLLIRSMTLVLVLACALFVEKFSLATLAKDYALAMKTKVKASMCFLAIGVMGLLTCTQGDYALKIIMGLGLGFCGDALLADRYLRPERHDALFVAGGVSFAIGHCLYVFAMLDLGAKIGPLTLPVFILIMAAAAVYARKKGTNNSPMKVCAWIYIALVSMMASFAIGAWFRQPSLPLGLMALGGALFVFSDNVLCAHSFGWDKRHLLHQLVHISYYAAQICIALSTFAL